MGVSGGGVLVFHTRSDTPPPAHVYKSRPWRRVSTPMRRRALPSGVLEPYHHRTLRPAALGLIPPRARPSSYFRERARARASAWSIFLQYYYNTHIHYTWRRRPPDKLNGMNILLLLHINLFIGRRQVNNWWQNTYSDHVHDMVWIW